jgi:hypothetical protein
MRRAALLISTFTALLAAGCGSAAHHAATTTTTTSSTTTSGSPAALEAGAREAVEQDHRLSVQTLWSDRVPTKPEAIDGPALSDLRRSVAERGKEKLKVRTLSEKFRVASLQLEPTYTTATAAVLDTERVQPYRDGHPHGKPSATTEHVRLILHRVGNSDRFDVWKVTLTK